MRIVCIVVSFALMCNNVGASDHTNFFYGHNVIKIVFTGNTQYWSGVTENNTKDTIREVIQWWKNKMPLASYTYEFVIDYLHFPAVADDRAFLRKYYNVSLHREIIEAAEEDVANLRSIYNADNAFIIFALDESGLSNAYKNGPMIILPRNTPKSLLAQHIGKIYGALVQSWEAGYDCTARSGILLVENQNSSYSLTGKPCLLQVPSIMKDHFTGWSMNAVDSYALGQMGYKDSDFDGLIDPIDTVMNPYSIFVPLVYN